MNLICASCSGALPKLRSKGSQRGSELGVIGRRSAGRQLFHVALGLPPPSLDANAKGEGEETEIRCKAFRVTRFFPPVEVRLDSGRSFSSDSDPAGGGGAIR